MVSQTDILHCASMLLRSYGREDATYRAMLRADACRHQEDFQGQQLWNQVLVAIKKMASTGKEPADLVH